MSSPVPDQTRVFTISLPEPIAQRVEEIVRDEKLDVGEFFERSIQAYQLESLHRKIDAARRNAPPDSDMLTEADAAKIVQEYRRNIRERKSA